MENTIHTVKQLATLEKMQGMKSQLASWIVESFLPEHERKLVNELYSSLNYHTTVAKEKYHHLKGETVVFSKLNERTMQLKEITGVITDATLSDDVYVEIKGDDEFLYVQPLSAVTSVQKAIEDEMALSMSLLAKIEAKM